VAEATDLRLDRVRIRSYPSRVGEEVEALRAEVARLEAALAEARAVAADRVAADEARVRSEEQLARESEARLRRAQEQLTLTLESARMGTYAYDLAAGRMHLSDGAAELLGVPRGSSAAHIIDSAVHPEDRPRIAEVWRQAVTELRPYQIEYRIERPDGSTRWIQSRSSFQTGEDGAPTHLLGVLGDITEKKRAEAELLAERHTLEAIFQASPAAMALWRGPELVFDKVNREYQKIVGDRPLAGRPLLEAIPELADQGFAAQLQRVLETGEAVSGTETLARLASHQGGPLEDHYYDFSYVRLEDPEGRPLGVYDHAVDVTERVRARRDLERSRDELRRTVSDLERERVLRERFVAALSHDLRSPLGVVRLCVDRLQRLKGLDETAHVLAARMIRNVERVDQMIEDQLDAQSLGAGGRLTLQLEACDLAEVAAAALKDLTSVHGDRFVLRTSGELRGRLDCKYVRRVLENLCANAVKYGAPARPVTLTLAREGRDALLSVHDHGAPIPASDQAHLFEAFGRAPAARAGGTLGWGLGLLLVRGAVEAHGGTVGVRSSAEEGTTFTARLPLEPPPAT
jgi:PAS domain S-box-containing protein